MYAELITEKVVITVCIMSISGLITLIKTDPDIANLQTEILAVYRKTFLIFITHTINDQIVH